MAALTTSFAESALQEYLKDCVSRGANGEGMGEYNRALTNFKVDSAWTHHLAFILARELDASLMVLQAIFDRACKCADFGEKRLDFRRDWAIYNAEHGNISEALSEIKEVRRSRRDDEGQDRGQLPIDELAEHKIWLFGGEAETAKKGLYRLISEAGLPEQTKLDVAWWYLVATIQSGDYWEATKWAWEQPGWDPKFKRQLVRIVAATLPVIGPELMRPLLVRMLKR